MNDLSTEDIKRLISTTRIGPNHEKQRALFDICIEKFAETNPEYNE